MRLTYVSGGRLAKRVPGIRSHEAPSVRVSQTLPSSVPANSSPGRIGDSMSDVIVPNVSAPVASVVMPPVVFVLTRIFMVSRSVRSGEMTIRSSPRLVDLTTRFAPA